MSSNHQGLSSEELKKANIKNVLRVTAILSIVTAIEFVLAFTWPESISRTPLVLIFLLLTVVKAFYIVSEFMHLGHEVKALVWSIVLPIAFVVWLVVTLLLEGGAIYEMLLGR